MDNRSVVSRACSPELIGRRTELKALESALADAADGAPGLILIAGASGVGKTRLVREFADGAALGGTLVLSGDCIELSEGEIAFAPVIAALNRLARELDGEDLDAIFGPVSGELIRLFPDLARSAVPGPESLGLGSLGQARLFEYLLGVFRRLAAEQPIAVVIEDLHWADRSTRDLLLFLARSLRDERVLLVVTYRSDELHRRHPLRPFLAQLGTTQGVDRIEVEPLSRAEVANQLDGILGEPAGPAVVDAIYKRAEGNPLFTEELIAARMAGETVALPGTVRDALLLRVEALPKPAQEVVHVVAAAGRRAQHDLVATVVDLPERELFEAVREAVSQHVLVEASDERSYEFRHALLREAVYGDLLPGERTKLHLELARAMEADPELLGQAATAAAELAYHWYSAHDLGRTVSASIEAGYQSERIYAFAEAQRHFERALELWDCHKGDEQTDRFEVMRRAAAAAHNAGDGDRAVALARALVEELDAEADREAASLALERLGRYLWTTGRGEEALPIYRQAVEMLPPTPSVALAQALASEAQVLMLLDRADEARALCDRALPIAREVGARSAEASILNTLIGCFGGHEMDVRGAIESMDQARILAEELDLPEELLRSYMNGADALDEAGRVEESLALVLEGVDAARRFGLERHMGRFLEGDAAMRLARVGRFEEATKLADGVIATPASPLAVTTAKEARALVAMERGEFDLARELLEDTAAPMARHGGSMWVALAANPLSRLAIREGRSADARAIVAETLDPLPFGQYIFCTAPLYWAGISAEADAAERARPLRHSEALAESERRAVALLERFDRKLATYERFAPPPLAVAWRAMSAAELTRLQGASDPAAWAEAAERFDALGEVVDAAYARYRQAEAMALARSPRDEISPVLLQSRAIAVDLEMHPLLSQIDSLARRARLKLGEEREEPTETEPTPADDLGLTGREREVLELVSQGLTNREIGERLYMSEKTASVHVSRILSKLGAANRAEAAASAERLGLAGSR
jgi:DNA-binding CsgD family transcriptional regulator